MSLKRKLAADDDEGELSPAVAAPSASSSPSAAPSSVPQPASVASKRPRRHQPAPSPAPGPSRPAQPARPSQPSQPSAGPSQPHGSLQRAGDARPRASSAPCSSRHHRSGSRSQATRAIAPLPRVPSSAAEKVVYPSWAPDVTRHSLRSIDLDVLQYNTQFRHDFMLDGPHKFTRVLGKPKREDSTRYWLAVLMELETGCTCVAFDEANKVWPCVCPDARPATAAPSAPGAPQIPGKMPSRVLPMLVELRTLLRHVTSPASAVSPNDCPFRPPPPEPAPQHPDQLSVLLDEHRVFDDVRRGTYDHVPLFRYIGQLLKEHCAPMRDARIDNMVAFACDGPPADPARPPTTASWKSHVLQAIRMCFEILELMAMDIANHQLLTHRARLMATTASLELSAFRNKFLLHDPPTLQVAAIQTSLQQRLDAVRALGTGTGVLEDQLRASLVRTVVDLMFDPAVLGGPRSPGLRIPPNFPETFYLDHSRMCRFSSEACDLSVLYMLLLLARSPPFSVSDASVAATLKSEIASIAPPRLGLCFGSALRSRHHAKDSAASEWEQWRQGISDVLLQIARGAAAGGVPSQGMLETLERWADTNLQERSALAGVCQKRLREALYEAVAGALQHPPARATAQRLPVPVLAPLPQQPCAQAVLHVSTRPPVPLAPLTVSRYPVPPPPAQSTTSAASAAGLDVFAIEIDSLARRIAEVVAHHWTVYKDLYTSPGFLH